MAAIKKGAGASFAMATRLLVLKYLTPSPSAAYASSQVRTITAAAASSLGQPTEIIVSHTDKWMQDTSKKSPMQLIKEVPPIKVEGRIVACEGDSNPALGHPIEFICLDLDEPAICKYCGLRYVQDHGSHHH